MRVVRYRSEESDWFWVHRWMDDRLDRGWLRKWIELKFQSWWRSTLRNGLRECLLDSNLGGLIIHPPVRPSVVTDRGLILHEIISLLKTKPSSYHAFSTPVPISSVSRPSVHLPQVRCMYDLLYLIWLMIGLHSAHSGSCNGLNLRMSAYGLESDEARVKDWQTWGFVKSEVIVLNLSSLKTHTHTHTHLLVVVVPQEMRHPRVK